MLHGSLLRVGNFSPAGKPRSLRPLKPLDCKDHGWIGRPGIPQVSHASVNLLREPAEVAKHIGSVENAPAEQGSEGLMNHSFYSSDRATHLKIVVVALLMATTVAALGLCSFSSKMLTVGNAAVLKPGNPMAVSSSTAVVVR